MPSHRQTALSEQQLVVLVWRSRKLPAGAIFERAFADEVPAVQAEALTLLQNLEVSSDKKLDLVRKAISSPNSEVRDAGLRALPGISENWSAVLIELASVF